MTNSIKELNRMLQDKYGYNLVALPSSGIRPLQVLYKKKEGILSKLKNLFGDTELSNSNSMLDKLLKSTRHPFPEPFSYKVNSELKNTFNENLSVEGALELLLNISSISEEEKSKIEALFKKNIESSFNLGGDAIEETIDHLELDSFVSGAKIVGNLGNTFQKRLKESDLFITTSVLKSKSFSLISKVTSESMLNVNFSEIEDIVNAKSNFRLGKKDDSEIKFEGDEPIVFAIKAVQLKFKRNEENRPDFFIRDQQNVVVKSGESLPFTFLALDGNEAFEF